MPLNKDISLEIKEIFDNNTLSDLKRFLHKRERLNRANSYLIYLFYLVQSAGILTTSVAAGNNDIYLLWSGIGLNVFASLIHVYEKLNNSIMKKVMNDIKSIKNGTYVDEGEMIDPDEKSTHDNKSNTTYSALNVNTPLLNNVQPSTPNAVSNAVSNTTSSNSQI